MHVELVLDYFLVAKLTCILSTNDCIACIVKVVQNKISFFQKINYVTVSKNVSRQHEFISSISTFMYLVS